MIHLTFRNHLRHLWIRSRWKSWSVPLLCSLPYLGSLFWLLLRGQVWIVQVMLAPLFMGALLAALTLLLSHLEYRR